MATLSFNMFYIWGPNIPRVPKSESNINFQQNLDLYMSKYSKDAQNKS